MRIAMVSGNREMLPDPVIPFGLLYVAASIPEKHSRLFVDLCFEGDPRRALASQLRDFKPDLVALGMRNIQNSDYSGTSHVIGYYKELVDTIREATDAPLVMGGAGFSVMPAELMEVLKPDFGISGEAEVAFPALIVALEGRADFEMIPCLYRFDEGVLFSNAQAADFLDMSTLPRPDRSLVDPRYYEVSGIESLQTKRGCPLRCDYCTYPTIEGRVGRTRNSADVADEFEFLTGLPDVNHVFVVDSVFNLPRTHAKAICRELIDRKNRLPWTCYVNPLGFDAELADLMHRAGCAGMEVGADSGSDEILKRLRKGFTTKHLRDLHDLATEHELPDCHTFLLGTPGESFDDVKRTLDFIIDLDPYSAILMAWVDDYEVLDPDVACERRALRERILQVVDDEKGNFPWWSIPSLGFNYSAELFAALRKNGLQGPLWQHLRGTGKAISPTASPRRARSGARAATSEG